MQLHRVIIGEDERNDRVYSGNIQFNLPVNPVAVAQPAPAPRLAGY